MSATVLITARSLTAAGLDTIPELQPLRDAGFELVPGPRGRRPDPDELKALVPSCVGWLAGTERIPAEVLAAAPHLRVISRYGVGVDSIDLEAAARLGIKVERAVGSNARGVAELAVALVLNALRGIAQSHRGLLEQRWVRVEGRELGECSIGIVGYGSIGRHVHELLAPLARRVLIHDPIAEASNSTLEELLAASDVVTLHCPPSADGVALIGERELSLMPARAVLVNTARSILVDDNAVLTALKTGTLNAYAVDAFDTEPPPLTELLSHPCVIATAHIGALTSASAKRTAKAAVANLLAHMETR